MLFACFFLWLVVGSFFSLSYVYSNVLEPWIKFVCVCDSARTSLCIQEVSLKLPVPDGQALHLLFPNSPLPRSLLPITIIVRLQRVIHIAM